MCDGVRAVGVGGLEWITDGYILYMYVGHEPAMAADWCKTVGRGGRCPMVPRWDVVADARWCHGGTWWPMPDGAMLSRAGHRSHSVRVVDVLNAFN